MNSVPVEPQGLVVTPNVNAARAQKVSACTLEDLAVSVVGKGRLASPLLAHDRFRRAVEATADSDDPTGTAHVLAPTVRELFRADVDLSVLEMIGAREARLARVANLYRNLLREEDKLDPAEVFSVARRELREQRLVTVVGHPRLGEEEVRFVDAVAAQGSSLVLPHADDYAFVDTDRAREFLEAAGWRVVEEKFSEPWSPHVDTRAHHYPHREAEVRGRDCKVVLG